MCERLHLPEDFASLVQKEILKYALNAKAYSLKDQIAFFTYVLSAHHGLPREFVDICRSCDIAPTRLNYICTKLRWVLKNFACSAHPTAHSGSFDTASHILNVPRAHREKLRSVAAKLDKIPEYTSYSHITKAHSVMYCYVKWTNGGRINAAKFCREVGAQRGSIVKFANKIHEIMDCALHELTNTC